jgi:hypothetical protein
MRSLIAATARREPMHRRPIHRKAAARFPAAFRALFRFPTRTVRKPQEAVILVTITACLMVETDDRQWGRHTRDHRNRESGKKSRRPYAPCRQRRIEVGVGDPPSLSKSFSLAPVFLGLALHRWSRRVRHFEPISRAA